jgi:Type II secretion system (T2SS), protein E, N-terminal domain
MRQVEEALARQVIYGGDLVTNLLEVARVDEVVLSGLLAESMRLTPAPAGELPRTPDEVKSLVPREIAVQRTLVPLEVQADGKLVLAVAEPLPAELAEQLRFALGMTLEQRAAPAVRVHQAMARTYGVPLERRMVRLIQRLGGDLPEGGSTPPPLGFASVLSEPPRPAGADVARERAGPVAAVVGRLVAKVPGHRITNAGFPGAPPQGGPAGLTGGAPAPAAAPQAAFAQSASRASMTTTQPGPGAFGAGVWPAPASPAAGEAPATVRGPGLAPDAPAATASPGPPLVASPTIVESPAPGEVRSGLLHRAASLAPRPLRRRRGPITIDQARSEADDAADRDALLDLFFDFSQQFFDYSALFLVHGELAEGRDAFGGGASRERVLGIGVPLDLPSLLSGVREKRLSVVARAPADGLDAVLLADLQRPRDSEMAIVPLVVRTRAVALLIGDCGDAGIDRESVQQVVSFSGVVGKAFERIIVRRKLDGFIAGGRDGTAGRVSSSIVPAKPASPAPASPSNGGAAPAPSNPPPSFSTTLVSSAPGPVLSRPSASSPPVPFVPRRAAASRAPASTSGLPPPAANVAVVRRISGPPIPREEPDTPGAMHAVVRTSPPPPGAAPSSPGPSRSSPDLEIVELPMGELEGEEPGGGDVARALFEELGWASTDPPDAGLPPSSAVAVAPHRPPAAVAPAEELPSVIVDDLDTDFVAMVDRLASGEVDDTAEGELLRQGERAMRAIMSRFPGPVSFSRARIATSSNPPRASDCGPILRLVARERRVALPFVLDRLAAPDAEVRGWAAHLVCELPYVEAVPRLVPCLRDPDASASASAGLALAAIAKTAPEPVRDALLVLAHAPAPADRAAALPAIARLRDASFVPELVRALGDPVDAVVAAAHAALVQVTLQDLGTDARLWLRWWDQHSGRHRIEWLIDALGHDVTELRKIAAEELRALTKEYFGYAGDLPPRDRDRAQQRYRDWWEMEGRSRFRRS